MTPSARLKAANLTLAYGRDTIVHDLDIEIPDRGFTVIVGANGSGKSTLLKAFGRLLSPSKGTVVLDGRALSAYPSIEVARHIGILPQSATAPDRITVIDLVARGRYPHQTFMRQWSDADERAVDAALAATGIAEIATRAVDTLSGGQRQRVWIAMVLAQETPILLLDEPTTYLDMAHQVELLDLLADLNEAAGRTIVAVLHDLNQACRYASHIVALKSGRLIAEGPPAQIVTEELMEVVFGLPCVVVDDPVTHTPHVVPRGRRKASGRGGA